MTATERLDPVAPLALTILAPLLAGVMGCCGYTTAGLHRQDVKTVAIPIWSRGTNLYRRDLEFRLTEALVKRVQLDTPYKVVDKSKADTVLEGVIQAVDQRVLSFNPDTGEPRDIQLRLAADFRWTDLRTGEILVERKNIRAAGVYYLSDPMNEDFFEGSADAVNDLATRIVEQLESPW